MLKSFVAIFAAMTAAHAVASTPLTPNTQKQATGFIVDGKPLKTQRPDKQHLATFLHAVVDTSIASPVERVSKTQDIEKASAAIKLDISTLLAQLRTNGEAAQFDKFIMNQAIQEKNKALLSELQSVGGAVAALEKANQQIDDDIHSFKASFKTSWIPSPYVFIGINDAHARIGETLCGIFWWVISAGYGTTHAYYSCYK